MSKCILIEHFEHPKVSNQIKKLFDYCIFNGAKAYLLSKGIMLSNTQGQHQKVYHKFKNKVIKGVVGDELVKIYGDVKVKAEELLEILESERKKRGEFTYEKLPQANMKPAEESLENAKKFYRNIKALIG